MHLILFALAACLLGGCIMGNDMTQVHRTTVGQQLIDLAAQRRQGQLDLAGYMEARFRVLDGIDDGPVPDASETRHGGAIKDPVIDEMMRNRVEAPR